MNTGKHKQTCIPAPLKGHAMHKSEISTAATFAGAWLAQTWNDYLEPVLQGGLVGLTFVAALFMVWKRYIDLQRARKELKELEKRRAG